MYLNRNPQYYKGTSLHTERAPFLLLLQLKNDFGVPLDGQLFVCVRRVALRQVGHFMCGSANLRGRYVAVEGTFGNNGLPLTVERLPEDAVPVPEALYQQWAEDTTHNGVSAEVAEAFKAFWRNRNAASHR